MTSVAVGYLVFIDYLLRLDALIFRQTIPLHYLIVLTLVTVVLVIIAWKAGLGREQLLRGGMPSAMPQLRLLWPLPSGRRAEDCPFSQVMPWRL